MADHTKVHPDSKHLAHLIDLFLFKGAPINHDPDHPVEILINHGFVNGYAPTRRQPLWSAYRVANAKDAVDYDRPHLYYADERIEKTARLDNSTFGKHDGIGYHVGHMAPNSAINTQFGRLAQMETFFMSNMSPQRGTLNTGVWAKLEDAIRNIEDVPKQRDHVWAIVGPVFGDDPDLITRSDGTKVPIPQSYYCITLDPVRYPWDRPSNVAIAAFLIPQDAPSSDKPEDYLSDVPTIESKTKLSFFPGWQAEPTRSGTPTLRSADAQAVAPDGLPGSRMLSSLKNAR